MRLQITYYLIKIVVTTMLIVLISEIVKRNSFLGALLASIPFVSVLAMIWLYVETGDVSKVSAFAMNVFWLVLPSLVFFVSLPVFIKQGINFYISMSMAIVITVGCYWVTLEILHRF